MISSDTDSVNLNVSVSLLFNFSTAVRALSSVKSKVYGNLPNNIGDIYPNLKEMYLSENNITGTLPKSIGKLPLLKYLYVKYLLILLMFCCLIPRRRL